MTPPTPPSPRRLLLVGGAHLEELQRCLARRGIEALAVGYPREIATLSPDERAGLLHAEGVDFADPLAVHRRLVELHASFAFSGIVPVSEYGLLPAALACRRLGLPGASLRAVQHTRDKLRMREVLAAAGLGQVRFARCRTLDDMRRFQARAGGPIVVKPVAGSGSDGVTRVERPEQAQAAFELALSAPGADGALCEEFIEGPEISLEGYSAAGRFVPVAVTDKHTDARFLETGHTQPSRLPPEIRAEAWVLARRALQALGVDDAVTHTEMKLTPRGPVLLETHTRMGGDYIHTLTAHTTGVDLADVMVGLALGEPPDTRPRDTRRAAAVAFLLPPRGGRIARLELPAPAEGGEVVRARALFAAGEQVSGRSASQYRLAYALAVAATPEDALRAARAHLDAAQVVMAGEDATRANGGETEVSWPASVC